METDTMSEMANHGRYKNNGREFGEIRTAEVNGVALDVVDNAAVEYRRRHVGADARRVPHGAARARREIDVVRAVSVGARG